MVIKTDAVEKESFYELSKSFLLPLFSGTKISEVKSNSNHQTVVRDHPTKIKFKPDQNCDYRFILERSQTFSAVQENDVTEYRIVQAFVEVFNEIKSGLQKDFRDDILSTFQRRVISKAVCMGDTRQSTVLKIIDILSEWAARQYEGKPIAASIGLVKRKETDKPTIDDFLKNDYYAVLSNGFDTMLTVNYTGFLLAHESLPQAEKSLVFAPHRQAAIANWVNTKGIAFSLNRLGEIAIFKKSKLLFVKRSGRWHFLNHKAIFKQLSPPNATDIREAIYETMLDASFAHCGACIGIVTRQNKKKWKKVVNKNDQLELLRSEKTRSLSRLIANRKFHELDRKFRQELVSIDGATLINYEGEILAVGAILEIPSGSSGGGRLAASKTLSEFGLGIKVSQDGGIKGFRKSENVFSIM